MSRDLATHSKYNSTQFCYHNTHIYIYEFEFKYLINRAKFNLIHEPFDLFTALIKIGIMMIDQFETGVVVKKSRLKYNNILKIDD